MRRVARNAARVGGVWLSGCALLVGDPHGTRVAPESDASGADASREAPDASPGDGATDRSVADAAQDAIANTDSGNPSDADAATHSGDSGAGDGGCPGTAGPVAVRVAVDGGPSFCVDSTEVTNAQYADFLASSFVLTPAAVPAGCSGVTSYTPSAGWPSPYGRSPVVDVNWCKAFAFCSWAGKRLCGEIGGGPVPPSDLANAALSEWYFACSGGGIVAYPYGNTFDVTVCGGNRTTNVQAVGTPTQCVGGFPALDNMSGNVWEWTNSCASTDATAFCHVMGGAYDSTATELECSGIRPWTRTSDSANIGFRCCADP